MGGTEPLLDKRPTNALLVWRRRGTISLYLLTRMIEKGTILLKILTPLPPRFSPSLSLDCLPAAPTKMSKLFEDTDYAPAESTFLDS